MNLPIVNDPMHMHLISGPFKLVYQNGFIRQVSYGDHQAIRMIYFALRDENWGTYPLKIRNEQVDARENSFSVSYDAMSSSEDVDLITWKVQITGDPTGTIQFTLEGLVGHDHLKNRAGFCVLHPIIGTAGERVMITHPNGSVSEETFPETVVPQNPFKNIASMRWQTNNCWYALTFEGDAFETEDQRNWGDASFKTFCTPIDIPFPSKLTTGDRIWQRITFLAPHSLPPLASSQTVDIALKQNQITLPEIGIGSSPFEMFNEKIFAILQELPLAHYRIDVDLDGIEWQDILANDLVIAQRLALPLELVLHLPVHPSDSLDHFFDLFQKENITLKRVLVLSKGHLTTRQQHIDIIPVIKELFVDAPVGAGTDFNFTELNQHRFAPAQADFVSFGFDPQEHASDDLTLIENTETARYALRSAQQIYGKSAHISPVLLKRKYNPYARDPSAFTISEDERTDDRQQTDFAALWLLGFLKSAAIGGAESVTLFQAIGPHGIISAEGDPYPVYDALKTILDFRDHVLVETTSAKPTIADSIHQEDGTGLFWNYSPQVQSITGSDMNSPFSLRPNEITKYESSAL